MSHANEGDPRPGDETAGGQARAGSEIERDAAAAKRTAGDAVDDARAKAEDLGRQAKQAAHDAAEDARDQARSFAEGQKDEVAGRVEGVADALRSAAGSLDDQQQPAIAGYARQAASGLEQMSDALAGRSVDDLVGTVEDFAKRQPVAFLGGAVLAGFVLARFARSSADRRHDAAYRHDDPPHRYRRSPVDPAPEAHHYNPGGMAPETSPRQPAVDSSNRETR